MTHIGPSSQDMPYDREIHPWPHPSWLAMSVWKATALLVSIIAINLASIHILLLLVKGFRP